MRLNAIGLFLAGLLGIAQAAGAAPPPVEAYGKLPGIEFVKMAPAGARYAFVATVGEKRQLFVSTTDNKPLQVLEIGQTKVRDLEWAGDDHVMVFYSRLATLGPEFNVWHAELGTWMVLNVVTGKSFQVFHDQGNKIGGFVQGEYGTAQIDGQWYGWFGGRTCDASRNGCYESELHNYPDLYRVDLDSGTPTIAAHGSFDSRGWLVSPTGDVVARASYDGRNGDWRLLAGKAGGQALAGGTSEFGGVAELQFGRTPDTVLAEIPVGDGRSGGYDYRELSIGSASASTGVDTARMYEPLIDPATHLWIGQILRNDEKEAVFFNPALQAKWQGTRKAFPNYIVHLKSWSADFNHLVVLTEGGDDAGTYWHVDIQKHSADPIGSPYADVRSTDVGPVQMIDYKAADGLALRGVLTLPPGRQPKSLPLVVLPHGGPESRDYLQFDWWAQAYASRGYAVFQPNFRGSGDYGVKLRNAGFGEWGRKMQTDISDGVAELAKRGVIDPKRACIVGGSYGGYAALAGVTVQNGLYRCAVSVAGVSDLPGFLNYQHRIAGAPTSPALRYWHSFMGVDSASDSRLAAITPAALADKADAPILLIHGRDDTVVPIDQSEAMESALKRAGKPVEFVEMKNEDHWLSREETRVEMLKAAVAFVEKYNPAN
jgi:dipeptidyl aminopeptidase/acylaminoacyl peptidase